MDINRRHTVLLFFTRSAEEEAQAKRFTNSNSFSKNRSVAKKLISQSYKQIRASGLPAVTFSSEKQEGDSFGERIAHAYETLFAEGYENVIAVGNDCMQLSAETISQASNLLKQTPVVIGPATDGGAYLIGINREAFDKNEFQALAWQTDRLLDNLTGYARRGSRSLSLLEELHDIDYASDLRTALQEVKKDSHYSYSYLAEAFYSILQSLIPRYTEQRTASFLLLFADTGLRHRGPPFQ